MRVSETHMVAGLITPEIQPWGEGNVLGFEEMTAEREGIAAELAARSTKPVAALPAGVAALAGFDAADPTTWGDPGRMDPCPCGSGKKFKHCHGAL